MTTTVETRMPGHALPLGRKEPTAPAHAAVVRMWMNRDEVCRHLGVSLRTLRRLVKNGDVERRTAGRRFRYRPSKAREVIRADLEAQHGKDIDFQPPQLTLEELQAAEPDLAPTETQIGFVPNYYEEGEDTDPVELIRAMRVASDQRDRAYAERDKALEARAEALLKQEQSLARLEDMLDQRDKALEANRALLEAHRQTSENLEEVLEHHQQTHHQRDEAIKQLAKAVNQRDKAIEQRDKVLSQLDRAMLQRDMALGNLDKAIEERTLALGHYEYARQLLMEWSAWRDGAQEVLGESELRAERAQKLANEALEVPWYAFARRKAIKEELEALR